MQNSPNARKAIQKIRESVHDGVAGTEDAIEYIKYLQAVRDGAKMTPQNFRHKKHTQITSVAHHTEASRSLPLASTYPAIDQFCETMGYFPDGNKKDKSVRGFFGLQPDVECAGTLFEIIDRAMVKSWLDFQETDEYAAMKRNRRTMKRVEIWRGIAQTIRAFLMQEVANRRLNQTSEERTVAGMKRRLLSEHSSELEST